MGKVWDAADRHVYVEVARPMRTIAAPMVATGRPSPLPAMNLSELEVTLHTGDIVFTRIRGAPFRQLADATGSWTNHVGIVVGFDSFGAVIAESRVPLSSRTRFANFVRRSADGRVAVLRLSRPLSGSEIRRLECAARCRLGRLYDTGFSLRSRRQFCSRFVHEVLQESTGVVVGEITTFRDLFERNPGTNLRLWKIWFFGRIPWERTTVTPASLYTSTALKSVFDGKLRSRARPRRSIREARQCKP